MCVSLSANQTLQTTVSLSCYGMPSFFLFGFQTFYYNMNIQFRNNVISTKHFHCGVQIDENEIISSYVHTYKIQWSRFTKRMSSGQKLWRHQNAHVSMCIHVLVLYPYWNLVYFTFMS